MKKSLKTLFSAVCLGLCAGALAPQAALAHGEKALEPFVRMRTIQWYDVAWSKAKLNVNEEVVITGKFHVNADWPRGVAQPDATLFECLRSGARLDSNRALPQRTIVRQLLRFEARRRL